MRLSAVNINFGYEKDKLILDGINFHIDQGEIVGLMAPSGRGKSTLAKILAGYEKPFNGEVLLDGKKNETKGYNPIQLIYQHPEKAVNPLWKMRKILSESGEFDKETMGKMGINEMWFDRWPIELSGGELQRFCVLRVLNAKTKFIIADEISTMLDPITQAQIWEVVVNYAKENNIGVLVISHDKSLLDRLCTRIVKI